MLIQIIINSLIAGSLYALVASGFTLIYGSMRFFNMCYGVSFMLGAYLFYFFYTCLNFPIYIAIIIAIICLSFFMILIDRLTLFKLRKVKASNWSTMMASIGIAILIEALISTTLGSDVRAVRTEIQSSYTILGAAISPNQVRMICVSFITIFLVLLFLKKTKTGKAIRAVANDSEMATVIGIDTEKIYIIVMVIGYGLSSIGGAFVALDSDIEPMMGQSIQLKAIVASVIGGIGNIHGALWGGLILGFVENFGIWKISAGWKDGIALSLLVVFIICKPSIFGVDEDK